MKKLTLLFLLLISFSAYASAQSTYSEVVYLKNGSIIRGVIIEQVPNVSLKIKTADGNVFAYFMTDVEKITKEETPMRQRYASDQSAKSYLRGYKGFVDAGYRFDVSDNNANSLEISTAHGYQFNNYFFLGGGVGVTYYTDAELVTLPFFTNFRANFTNKRITPFADVKLGYSMGDVSGAYTSLAIGVRFAMQGKKALNLRLEYAAQELGLNSDFIYNDDSFTVSSLGLKIGFEF